MYGRREPVYLMPCRINLAAFLYKFKPKTNVHVGSGGVQGIGLAGVFNRWVLLFEIFVAISRLGPFLAVKKKRNRFHLLPNRPLPPNFLQHGYIFYWW